MPPPPLSERKNKASASGDGSTHIFNYNFKIFADTDLQVIVRSSAGVETTQTLNVNYVVTGANSGVGFHVARRLASYGATVLMGCRSDERCQKAKKYRHNRR